MTYNLSSSATITEINIFGHSNHVIKITSLNIQHLLPKIEKKNK